MFTASLCQSASNAMRAPYEIIPREFLISPAPLHSGHDRRQIKLQHRIAKPKNANNAQIKEDMINFINSVRDQKDPCYSSLRCVLLAAIRYGYVSLITMGLRKNIIDTATIQAFLVDEAITHDQPACLRALMRNLVCLEYIRSDPHPLIYACLEAAPGCLDAIIRAGAPIDGKKRHANLS